METILGIFNDREKADKTITELEEKYFNPKDISVIARDYERVIDHRSVSTEENVTTGAAEGATAGGVIGGLAGLLVGAGIISIPGIGAILIGGPVAAAFGLTGVAAVAVSAATTGLIAGGVVGALIGLGLPTEQAKEYEKHIREGAILLAVQSRTRDESRQVKNIFSKNKATQIRSIGEPNYAREEAMSMRG